MISWSLLTAHTIFKIVSQFFAGSYDDQERPLTTITTQFFWFC